MSVLDLILEKQAWEQAGQNVPLAPYTLPPTQLFNYKAKAYRTSGGSPTVLIWLAPFACSTKWPPPLAFI